MRVTRRLLWIAVLFQAVLLLVVVAHPNQKSIFEWWHRFFLVGGSIAIGAALGRARRANAAVVAFLVLASGLAIAAILYRSLTASCRPIRSALQKNFVGAMTAAGVADRLLRPAWLRLTRGSLSADRSCLRGRVCLPRSRGVRCSRSAPRSSLPRCVKVASRAASSIAIAVVAPLRRVRVGLGAAPVRSAPDQQPHLPCRLQRAGLSRVAPVAGVRPGLAVLQAAGRRCCKPTPRCGCSDPRRGWRRRAGRACAPRWAAAVRRCGGFRRRLRRLAFAFLVGRFVHGLFDIYWVAGTTTLPWLIVGIACRHGRCRRGRSTRCRVEGARSRPPHRRELTA